MVLAPDAQADEQNKVESLFRLFTDRHSYEHLFYDKDGICRAQEEVFSLSEPTGLENF